jgi:hypothetical protein
MALHRKVYGAKRRRLPQPRMMPAARPIESMPPSNVDAKRNVTLERDVAFLVIGAALSFRRAGPGVIPFLQREKAPGMVCPLTAPLHGREFPRAEEPFRGKPTGPACSLKTDGAGERRR